MSFKGTAELIPIPRPRQSHVLELMEDVPLAVIYLTSPEPASLPVFLVLVDDDVISQSLKPETSETSSTPPSSLGPFLNTIHHQSCTFCLTYIS